MTRPDSPIKISFDRDLFSTTSELTNEIHAGLSGRAEFCQVYEIGTSIMEGRKSLFKQNAAWKDEGAVFVGVAWQGKGKTKTWAQRPKTLLPLTCSPFSIDLLGIVWLGRMDGKV